MSTTISLVAVATKGGANPTFDVLGTLRPETFNDRVRDEIVNALKSRAGQAFKEAPRRTASAGRPGQDWMVADVDEQETARHDLHIERSDYFSSLKAAGKALGLAAGGINNQLYLHRQRCDQAHYNEFTVRGVTLRLMKDF